MTFERRVQPAGRRLEDAGLDLDAGCSETREPPAVDHGVRITGGDDRPSDAGVDDRARARRRPSDVIAGLERAVEGGAAGEVARGGERADLGVRRSGTLVPALTDDVPVANDDGADHGVG